MQEEKLSNNFTVIGVWMLEAAQNSFDSPRKLIHLKYSIGKQALQIRSKCDFTKRKYDGFRPWFFFGKYTRLFS